MGRGTAQMFSISCSFLEIFAKLYAGAHWRVGAPPTGNPGSVPGHTLFVALQRHNDCCVMSLIFVSGNSCAYWNFLSISKDNKTVALFIYTVADLKGDKFFQFHAVFGKIWQIRMLAPPPRGNPGSATDICYHHEDASVPDASEANNMTSIMKQMDITKAAVRVDDVPGTKPNLGEMGSKSVENELLSSTIWTRHPSNTQTAITTQVSRRLKIYYTSVVYLTY